MNKKKLFMLTGLIVVVLVIWFLISRYHNGFSATFNLKPGYNYIYSLDYSSGTEANFSAVDANGETMSSHFTCELDVILHIHSKDEKDYSADLSFDNISHCTLNFPSQGIDAKSDVMRQILIGRRAFVNFDRKGRIGRIAFAKNEDITFKSVAKLLIGELQVNLGSAKNSWELEETDQYGVYYSKYTVNKLESNGMEIEKKKLNYKKLLPFSGNLKNASQENNSVINIVLSREGYIDSIKGRVSVNVAGENEKGKFEMNNEFTLVLKEIKKYTGKMEPRGGKYTTESKLGVIDINDKMTESLNRSQAKEMTATEFRNTIRKYASYDRIYDNGLFWWRASGFLKLNPSFSSELVKLFREEGMSSNARLALMGILGSVGHREAQEAIRSIVSSDEAKADRLYPIFLQNISLVKDPDKDTVKFMESLYSQARTTGKLRSSTALTVGAVSDNLKKSGNMDEAKRLNDILVSDLKNAKDDKEMEYMLDSLSNSGFAENIEVVKEYESNKNPRIRASVVNAVRKTQTEESEKILFKMASDKETLVQRQAIQTMGQYKLTSKHLEDVEKGIESGKIHDSCYMDVIHLLLSYPKEEKVLKNTLLEMKKRPMNNPHLESKINKILNSLE